MSSTISENIRLQPKISEGSETKQDIECIYCREQSIKKYHQNFFACSHKQVCLTCMIAYAESCLTQNSIPFCSERQCNKDLNYNDETIMKQLPSNLSERIQRAIREKKMKHRMKCTQPDCQGFIKYGTCNICQTIFCERCFNPQHIDNCLAEVNLPEGTKRCPQCGQGIEKEEGCLHMICLRCKHEFCFHCLQPWSQSHHGCEGVKSIWELIKGYF